MLPATVLVFCADSSGIQSVNMSRPKQAFVGCSTFTEATHISTPPSLLLRSARYERSDNCFCPLEELTLSLSEAEYLAASGYVACHTTGLLRSFLVLGTENSLVIGRLDLKHSEFESLGKVFLADLGGQEELCGVQGCWLADGPTVVALHQGRVIVAAEREEAHNVFDHDFQLRWKAHILDGQFKRLFVCGDRVLCLSSADIDVSSPPLSRLDISPLDLGACLSFSTLVATCPRPWVSADHLPAFGFVPASSLKILKPKPLQLPPSLKVLLHISRECDITLGFRVLTTQKTLGLLGT